MAEALFPLFPLEVVLFPEEPLPLHIFEERYKLMIGECLEAKAADSEQQEFGVVLTKDQEMYSVGCSARIVNLTRKYEDGRMDILTVGRRRFEILLTNEEKPYLQGTVEFFDDNGTDAPNDADADHAITLFRDLMQKLHQSSEMPIHLTRPYRHLSFRLAGPLPFDLDFKQQLLSFRNEAERLRHVVRAIESMSSHLDSMNRARSQAGGNGNVRHKS
jgi:Lon protease-like protein